MKTSTNPPAATQGTDAGKKIVGRKRGIVTDTLGIILAVCVCAANISDTAIGAHLLDQARADYPTISKAWADSGFRAGTVERGAELGIDVEVVPRASDIPGFHVVKRRWVVERSLGWLMFHRRLARDYETRQESSRTMIHWSIIGVMSRALTGNSTPTWQEPRTV